MIALNNKDEWPREDELIVTGPASPNPSPSKGLMKATGVNEDQRVADEQRVITTGEFPSCNSCGRTFISHKSDKLCIPCLEHTQRILDRVEEEGPMKHYKHLQWCVTCDTARRKETTAKIKAALDRIRKEEL